MPVPSAESTELTQREALATDASDPDGDGHKGESWSH